MQDFRIQPAIFVGHGSPLNAIEDNEITRTWESLGKILSANAPRAILGISAHWGTRGLFVNSQNQPRQIYDMYGFPRKLYELQYKARGNENLASEICAHLWDFGAQIDNSWGVDHGLWSVLCRIFPKADIELICMSVDLSLDSEKLLKIGQSLRAWREKGVLILGSGNIVHNLGAINWNMQGGYDWAVSFDEKIKNMIFARDFVGVANAQSLPEFKLCVPTFEHFAPLLYVLGASTQGDKISIFNEVCNLGSISMASYIFGEV